MDCMFVLSFENIYFVKRLYIRIVLALATLTNQTVCISKLQNDKTFH